MKYKSLEPLDYLSPKKFNKFYIKIVCPIFNKIKNINQRNKIIIFSSFVLVIIYILFGRESILTNKNKIMRSHLGDANKQYTLYVSSDNIKNKEIGFYVNSKRIDSNEADEYFYTLFDSILPQILGENTDFMNIKTNLYLKSKYKNGISANWSFIPKINTRENILKYSNLIDGFGNVNNENFDDDEEVEGILNVYFSMDVSDSIDNKKYKSDNYSIDIKVVKRDETYEQKLIKDIKRNIEYQNNNDSHNDFITLPDNIDGERITYKEKPDFSYLYIIVIAIIVCFILDFRDKDLVNKQIEKDKKEIQSDFPQIITKLLIYINAGVTIRNSFILIADNYINKLKNGQSTKRKAYEELKTLKTKIQSGENEEVALYDIAKNLNDNAYTRFFNILIQNIKNGNKDIKTILEVEVYDALYKMKNKAERLAEEASTKLILPLMMMLIIIFVIIMIPAFMSM